MKLALVSPKEPKVSPKRTHSAHRTSFGGSGPDAHQRGFRSFTFHAPPDFLPASNRLEPAPRSRPALFPPSPVPSCAPSPFFQNPCRTHHPSAPRSQWRPFRSLSVCHESPRRPLTIIGGCVGPSKPSLAMMSPPMTRLRSSVGSERRQQALRAWSPATLACFGLGFDSGSRRPFRSSSTY